ncbi:MAG: ATP-binding protein [Candidatus Thermoplasmatota archaeon]
MEEIIRLLDEYIAFILDEMGNFEFVNNLTKDFIGKSFVSIFEGNERRKAAKIFYEAKKSGKSEGRLVLKIGDEIKTIYLKIIKHENKFYSIAKELKKEKSSFVTDFLGNVIQTSEEWRELREKNIYDIVEEKDKLTEILSIAIEKGEYEGKISINEKIAKVIIRATDVFEFFIEEDVYKIFENILRSKNVNEIFDEACKFLEKLNLPFYIKLIDREKGKIGEEFQKFSIYKGNEIAGFISIPSYDKEKIEKVEFLRIVISNALENIDNVRHILDEFAIYKIDKDGNIIYVNNCFEKLSGYNFEELKGKNISDFSENREKFFEELSKGKIDKFLTRWKGKNKEFIAMEKAWTLDGEIISIVNDVTSEKEREKEAEFYNSLLRHDIYNKNEIAIGYLGLLEKANITKKQELLIKKIKEALHDINRLVSNVKKAEEIRKIKKEIHPVKVKEIIEEECSHYEEKLKEKGIKISCRINDVLILANDFLRDIFSNLIDNSIQHANCKNIEIYGEREGNFYKIYFTDDGKGISQEDLGKIFEEGWKKGGGGSGMGLYIVKKIMEQYDGKIELESDVGKGVKFTLYFHLPKTKEKAEMLRIRF